MGSNNRQMAPSPTATPAPVAGGLPPSGQQGALLQPMQAPMQAPVAPVSGVTPMPNVAGGMPSIMGSMPNAQSAYERSSRPDSSAVMPPASGGQAGLTPLPVSGGMQPVAGGMPPMQANPFAGGAPQVGAAKCPTCGK